MSNRYIVRFGSNRTVAEFTVHDGKDHQRSTQVVIKSDRGIEWGEVLGESSDRARKVMGHRESRGRILRKASDDDFRHLEDVRRRERVEFVGCKDLIQEKRLQMQLVDVEHLFGGERIVFYYLAENRVDFRELVKSLAQRYKTRIEMRQIGVRDEAKLLADYGDCGKPVCCNTHLKTMPPVSMKMAKLQKATLDPNKISGRCGRLKCCLRYEYDTYEEHRRELPRVGSTVVTREGQGRVVAQELLAKKVVVAFEDRRTAIVDLADIVTVISTSNGGGNGKGQAKSDSSKETADKPNAQPEQQNAGPAVEATVQPEDDTATDVESPSVEPEKNPDPSSSLDSESQQGEDNDGSEPAEQSSQEN